MNGTSYGQSFADFDQSYDPINGFSVAGTGSSYTVNDGDTLQTVALAAWGDASLWYLIAQANGMTGAETLISGTILTIPSKVTNLHNNSGTFKPYDPNQAMGDLAPTAVKPPKKPGTCAVIGQIIMVAIAVAVSALTYGAMTGPSSTILGSVLAGAVSGAAGSVASQGFGIATGLQQGFDWKGVGMAAIGGAIGGGLGKLQGLAEAGKLGSSSSIFGRAGILAGGGFVNGAVRGVASNLLTQGIGVATGLQDKFSWVGVASAAIGGGVSGQIGKWMAGDLQAGRVTPTLANGLANAGSAVANAGVRSLLTGTSFGDNLLAALPDVIGSTIGNLAASCIAPGAKQGPLSEKDLSPIPVVGDPIELASNATEPGEVPQNISTPLGCPPGQASRCAPTPMITIEDTTQEQFEEYLGRARSLSDSVLNKHAVIENLENGLSVRRMYDALHLNDPITRFFNDAIDRMDLRLGDLWDHLSQGDLSYLIAGLPPTLGGGVSLWGRGTLLAREAPVAAEGRAIATESGNVASNVALHVDYINFLRTAEAANPLVDSLRVTGRLPANYVTKAEAARAGWQSGKAIENFVPGGQIGGDVFQNSTNLLPAAQGRIWFEADVGLVGTMARANQPGTRLLYSNDGLMYVTFDHYTTAHPIGSYR